jgi:hypothetical protein
VDTLKLALEAQFKRLSLEQAQAAARLKSDTTLVEKDMDTRQKLAKDGAIPKKAATAEPMEPAVDVEAALNTLGLQ